HPARPVHLDRPLRGLSLAVSNCQDNQDVRVGPFEFRDRSVEDHNPTGIEDGKRMMGERRRRSGGRKACEPEHFAIHCIAPVLRPLFQAKQLVASIPQLAKTCNPAVSYQGLSWPRSWFETARALNIRSIAVARASSPRGRSPCRALSHEPVT